MPAFEQIQFDTVNPSGVAYCENPADVSLCLRFAADNDLPMAVRSGGHSAAGYFARTPAEGILRNDVVDRRPDKVWGDGGVTLLGDAAHPMNFNVGQGACQALEDALVLARSLATTADPVAALRAYETERRPRVHSFQKAARMVGRVGAWGNPVAVRARTTLYRAMWGGPVWKQVDKDMATGARWDTRQVPA